MEPSSSPSPSNPAASTTCSAASTTEVGGNLNTPAGVPVVSPPMIATKKSLSSVGPVSGSVASDVAAAVVGIGMDRLGQGSSNPGAQDAASSFTTSSSAGFSHHHHPGRLSIDTGIRKAALNPSALGATAAGASVALTMVAASINAPGTHGEATHVSGIPMASMTGTGTGPHAPLAATGRAMPTMDSHATTGAPLRRTRSLSFFIDLESLSIMVREDLSALLAARMQAANVRRMTILHEVRSSLVKRNEHIRHRVLLLRQREKLSAMKLKARSEFSLSAASLRRQLILKQSVDRCGALVEHAQTVAMIQRLRRVVELRRAFSENFKDVLEVSSGLVAPRDTEDVRLDVDDIADMGRTAAAAAAAVAVLSSSTARSRAAQAFGDRLDFDDEDGEEDLDDDEDDESYDAEPSSSALTPPSPPASGLSTPTSRASRLSSPSTLTTPSPPPTSTSGIHPTAFSKASSPASSPPPLPSLSLSPSPTPVEEKGESLVETIRRLRSLPVELFVDLDEVDYAELGGLLPPVTRFTLRELDMDEIISNVQLRHDLYFDPNLQFKPNLEGERGKAKLARCDEYWSDLHMELTRGHFYRVPLLLFEVRSILVELIPYNDEMREELERHVDEKLVAQELEHGVFNGTGLVTYMANVLKSNCAPARDGLVELMCETAGKGDWARCLRAMFEVLEWMKLDYANHQLLRLRPFVVEHAVEFERR
ncbi:hypothetical protein HK101_009667, partial [Irineochytrium annulatum]